MKKDIATKEYFELAVIVTKPSKFFKANILFKGRLHTAQGSTEQEASDNLWDYLIDKFGI